MYRYVNAQKHIFTLAGRTSMTWDWRQPSTRRTSPLALPRATRMQVRAWVWQEGPSGAGTQPLILYIILFVYMNSIPIYIYTYAYIYLYIYICTPTYMRTYIHIHIHTYTYTYTCMMHSHTHTLSLYIYNMYINVCVFSYLFLHIMLHMPRLFRILIASQVSGLAKRRGSQYRRTSTCPGRDSFQGVAEAV